MKKKNLLKCLALTSMLALSVGAVTSCGTQGEAGKDGAQGVKGDQGAKGEQGDQGEKGDTSYEVIVLGAANGKIGVTINDKATHTGIAGDTWKLTFTPDTGYELVSSLVINQEEVTIDSEIINGSYDGIFADATGSIIVSASFGKVKDYVVSEVYKEVWKLWESDKEIYLSKTDDTHKLGDDDKQASYAYYEMSKDVDKAALAAIKAAQKKVTDLTGTPTVAEKIAAAKTGIDEGIKAIDDAYTKVIKDAKEEANKTLVELNNSLAAYTAYTATDKASILASAKAAIEASTTLEGLSKVIDSYKVDGNSIGKFTHTYEAKKACFEAINGALSTVPAAEPFGTGEEEDLAKLEAKLEKYGLSVDQLPNEVADAWRTKVSSEVDFPVYAEKAADDSYAKGAVIMGVEAVAAIKKSYNDIKEALKEAILNTYFKEINASKILNDDGKTTMRGVVSSSINTWVKTLDLVASPKTLDNYMSTTAPTGVDTVDGGMVGFIEKKLAQAIASNTAYKAFGKERMETAVAAVISSLKAEKDAVMTGTYSAYVGGEMISADATSHASTYKILQKVGKKDTTTVKTQYDNPFVDAIVAGEKGSSATKDEDYAYVAKTKISSHTVTISAITNDSSLLNVTTTPAANASYVYDQMISYDSDGNLTGTLGSYVNGGGRTVLEVKEVEAAYTGVFKAIKSKVIEGYYSGQVAKNITANASTDNSYDDFGDYTKNYVVNATTLKDIFDGSLPQKSNAVDLTATSVDDIDNAMFNLYSKAKLLGELDKDTKDYANSFLTGTAGSKTTTDSHYVGTVTHVTAAPAVAATVGTALAANTAPTSGTTYVTKGTAGSGTGNGGKLKLDDGTVLTKVANTDIPSDNAADKYFPLTLEGTDAVVASDQGKLVEGTNVYKAILDSSDSTSIISKILSETYTLPEQVKAAFDDLDDTYKAGVAAYVVDAKSVFKDLYVQLNATITNLSAAKALKGLYDGSLVELGADHSKDTTGSLSGASDANKVLFKAETCDSVDAWYTAAASVLGLIGDGAAKVNYGLAVTASSGTVSAVKIGSTDLTAGQIALILALYDAKAMTFTDVTDSYTVEALVTYLKSVID